MLPCCGAWECHIEDDAPKAMNGECPRSLVCSSFGLWGTRDDKTMHLWNISKMRAARIKESMMGHVSLRPQDSLPLVGGVSCWTRIANVNWLVIVVDEILELPLTYPSWMVLSMGTAPADLQRRKLTYSFTF